MLKPTMTEEPGIPNRRDTVPGFDCHSIKAIEECTPGGIRLVDYQSWNTKIDKESIRPDSWMQGQPIISFQSQNHGLPLKITPEKIAITAPKEGTHR
jgi:hypothetical protein